MLNNLLEPLGDLLNVIGNLLGSLLDSLLGGLLGGPGDSVTVADTTLAAPASTEAVNTLVTDTIAEMSAGSNDLLETALSGADTLMTTGIVDSAHALGDLAQDLEVLTDVTIVKQYGPAGELVSVTEHISHAPAAAVMIEYIDEVLAPQASGLGSGVYQFMSDTGDGVGMTMDSLSSYQLAYSATMFGGTYLTVSTT